MLGLTAVEIAKLAFSGVIQAGSGALSVVGAKKLWQKIRDKFQGNPMAEQALNDAEQQQSFKILEQEVVPLLQISMRQDRLFAEEIQNIAQQINQEINAVTTTQKSVHVSDVKASGEGAAAFGNFEGNIQGKIGGTSHKEQIEKKL